VPDELFCANAKVLDKASAVVKTKLENFIAITSCCQVNDQPRNEFMFRLALRKA
jgi:hypothetical protein